MGRAVRRFILLGQFAVSLGTLCMLDNSTNCGRQYCDFSVLQRPNCGFVWPYSNGSKMGFMCDVSSVQGTCRSCPPGWTASGAFCVECNALKSCDRNGTELCDGACAPGRYPVCEAATGRVVCQGCSVDLASLRREKKSLTRGGVLNAPDLCGAYFQCDAGYYLASNASGQLTCLACEYPELSGVGRAFVTRGLTFGDKYSCLYVQSKRRVGNNSVGEYGSPIRSCPAGKTSEPGMAVNETDCVECPMRPVHGTFGGDLPMCVPTCLRDYTLRGETCVLFDPTQINCDFDGYTNIDRVCAPSPLPWSLVNWQGTDGVETTATFRNQELVAMDENGDFRVPKSTGVLAKQSTPNFCLGLADVIENKGYVQDKPFFTAACGSLEYHKMYHLASGPKFLYAFLERSFGNNNRFVMWQIQKSRVGVFPAGQVWQTFRMPAKVCSATVVPGDMVYIAFCGSSLVSFARQIDYMDNPEQVDPENVPFTLDQSLYIIGRRTGVLIGQEATGNQDGMLSQALFKGPLSIAATNNTNRLLVADMGNCRIVEVAIHFPGSFLTRATTIGSAACFSGDFPLPYPRAIVSVLAGAAALFVTDNGLVQLDARMRRFTTVLSGDEMRRVIGEPKWIRVEQGGSRLVMENETHSAAVTRTQEQCPAGFRAKRGGLCLPCAIGTYVVGGECAQCTAKNCSAGQRLVACSDTADAKCEACPASGVAYPFRYGVDCEIIPRYPCPVGYYGLDDCRLCSAVGFRQWPAHAYCQCLGVALQGEQRSCRVENPWPNTPDWLGRLRCDWEFDANCSAVGCFLASVQPRVCLPCPDGKVSQDGLHCEACPGYRVPSRARDACVCKFPSTVSDDGTACVCPAGHAAGGVDGCVPCPAGQVKGASSLLSDDYANLQGGQCEFCPPGQEPLQGAASCVSCEPGLYKESGMSFCAKCAVGVAYAADPTRGMSCVACEEECEEGQRWSACPVNSSFYACEPCPALSLFRQSVRGGRDCEWRCQAGFYEYNGQCLSCTTTECARGFKLTPCSTYEDSHCRVPCKDDLKPEENSVWLNDCYWDCAPGFLKITKEYPGWFEYACVKHDDYVPWSIGF